ncbi:MAG: fumarate hydratase [Spirochaetia bacterium]|nr:fumarate hydratase [Spirochaetia bacterium]
MRTITSVQIATTVAKLVVEANYYLPHDVVQALKDAAETEVDKKAKNILYKIIENHKISKKGSLPLCQDTGIAVIFVEIGSDVKIEGDIYRAINRGVEMGYRDGYLRKSVADPLSRENTGTNTPAIIHLSMTSGPNIKISLTTKGAGSENKSALKMMTPADGEEGIVNFVVETVKKAGASACPPYIVGVGIGGNMETCALLAKQSLLRGVGVYSKVKGVAKLESRMLKEINRLGIGPLGFGGNTTALSVMVETRPCHIASLPVAVCIQCHSARHKSTSI